MVVSDEVVVASGGMLLRVDAKDGHVIWKTAYPLLNRYPNSKWKTYPAIFQLHDNLLFVFQDDCVLAWDWKNRTFLWGYDLDIRNANAPVPIIYGDAIYLFCGKKRLQF